MSASIFGYPSIKTEYTNETNLRNTKSYLYQMSDDMSRMILQLQDEITELQSAVAALQDS